MTHRQVSQTIFCALHRVWMISKLLRWRTCEIIGSCYDPRQTTHSHTARSYHYLMYHRRRIYIMMVYVIADVSYDKKNEARPSKDPGLLVVQTTRTTQVCSWYHMLPTSRRRDNDTWKRDPTTPEKYRYPCLWVMTV